MSGELSWQVARVIGAGGGRMRLEFSRPDFCARCQRGEGCGAGVFGMLLSRRSLEVDVLAQCESFPGNWVRVGLPASALIMAAVAVYGLPLLGFLVGALPAHWWLETGAWRDLLSLAGGLAAGALAWRLGQYLVHPRLHPVVEPLSCGLGATKSSLSR